MKAWLGIVASRSVGSSPCLMLSKSENSFRSLKPMSDIQRRLGQSKLALCPEKVLNVQERLSAVLKMQSLIRRYLPHLIVGLSISLVMVGAYMAVGFVQSSAPKSTCATNPLTITFAATAGQGSAIDSFTCDPSTTNVMLVAHASRVNIALSVAPSSFASSARPLTLSH